MWVVDSLKTLGWKSLCNNRELPRSHLRSSAKGRLNPCCILGVFLYFSCKRQDCITAREPACRNDLAAPNCCIRCLYDLDRRSSNKVFCLAWGLNHYLPGSTLWDHNLRSLCPTATSTPSSCNYLCPRLVPRLSPR